MARSPSEPWRKRKRRRRKPKRAPWVPAPPHENLAASIAALVARREELGISQLELDERVGFPLGLTGKYECGMRRPTGQSLAEWAQALDMRIAVVPR